MNSFIKEAASIKLRIKIGHSLALACCNLGEFEAATTSLEDSKKYRKLINGAALPKATEHHIAGVIASKIARKNPKEFSEKIKEAELEFREAFAQRWEGKVMLDAVQSLIELGFVISEQLGREAEAYTLLLAADTFADFYEQPAVDAHSALCMGKIMERLADEPTDDGQAIKVIEVGIESLAKGTPIRECVEKLCGFHNGRYDKITRTPTKEAAFYWFAKAHQKAREAGLDDLARLAEVACSRVTSKKSRVQSQKRTKNADDLGQHLGRSLID